MYSKDWRGAAGDLPSDWLGFRIESFVELAGWRTLHIPGATLATGASACPADGAPLRVLCTLVGEDGRARIGSCSTCGHVTLIDRPSQDWLDAFYERTWDTGNDSVHRPDSRRTNPPRLGAPREAVVLAQSLSLDRSRPVCEIGCGHGDSLRHLERAGFVRLVGVEPSRHRAAIARQSVGATVLSSPFEASITRDELRRDAPFALIFSIHALEHMFDPVTVLHSAAALQDEGDALILSVPNVVGEPSMGVLMFLPHVHSFSPVSLTTIAAACGYALVDQLHTTAWEITMVFRRAQAAAAKSPPAAVVDPIQKVVRSLYLDRQHEGLRRFHWAKRSDWSAQVAVESNIDDPAPPDGGPRRTIIVSPLERRHTDSAESLIEIQFTGGIQFFAK